MKIDAPPATGDPYVDSCFRFDFEEFDEPRVWHTIPVIKDIPLLADRDKAGALAVAEAALQERPDYSFLYYWVAVLRGRLQYPGEPLKTCLEGLQKGRNKPLLCGCVGMWEFDRRNLAEAARWWIKSGAIQFACRLSTDGFSLLNLAYIAEGLGLASCHPRLLEEAQRIQSIRFDSVGANERYRLASSQGNDSIKQAITLLCQYYPSGHAAQERKKWWQFWK